MEQKCKCILKYFLIGFAIVLVALMAVFQTESFLKIKSLITDVIEPFVYGFIIAYVMNPLESYFEKRIPLRNKQILRGVLTAIIVIILLILTLFSVSLIIPTIIESCQKFIDGLPTYINNTYNYLRNFIENHEDIAKIFMDNIDDLDSRYLHLEDVLTKASEQIEPYIQTWIKNLTDSIFVICRIVKNLILGLLVAVYLILNKEMLRSQFRVLFKRILKEKTYEVLHSFLMKLNQIFLDFIIGKTADSLIVFILSYITFLIAGMPSPLLISTIVGITNIIPCFGPFIGAIPSAIIVFMQEPSKLVLFIILIVIIQQIDGNIIGVKILGNKLNLPSVWVFFSILIFGSLFGVWGMIIGVPTFAVLYTTLKEFLNIKTKKDENV